MQRYEDSPVENVAFGFISCSFLAFLCSGLRDGAGRVVLHDSEVAQAGLPGNHWRAAGSVAEQLRSGDDGVTGNVLGGSCRRL